jgi:hypothetical protein
MDCAAAIQKKLMPIATPRARNFVMHFLPKFVCQGRLSYTSRSVKTKLEVANQAANPCSVPCSAVRALWNLNRKSGSGTLTP